MSVIEGQKRLIAIANSIKELSDTDANFIANALIKIAEGTEDPKAALNIKPRRGERTSKAYQQNLQKSEFMKSLAMGWFATATAQECEGGLGHTNEKAASLVGEYSPVLGDMKAFGFTEETLLKYWSMHPELRNRSFDLPN
jgi:hypothetical protein